MTRRTVRIRAAALGVLAVAGLALAACQHGFQGRLPFTAPPEPPLDFDMLASDPGVYSGRPVKLVGAMTVHAGQACLVDRNRQIAVRMTAEQASLYEGVQNWPVIVEGVFDQNLCPPGYACPEFCTPYGLAAGVRITDPAQE